MRKIIVGAFVSMDGVMQAPGGPAEDPTKGFKFGGWEMPYFDQEFHEELDRVFKEKFDLLLGRKTYEIFAAYWPYYDEGGPHGGIAKLFNDIQKYAVSRSGEIDTSWARSVLLRDIADVKRLKQEDGPDLVTQGSTELVHALLANDLVDAMSIFTVPVVLGGGKKLFADGSAPHSFKLTSSRVSSTGVLIGHYERDGEIKIGGTAIDSPSERETVRQERMKRVGLAKSRVRSRHPLEQSEPRRAMLRLASRGLPSLRTVLHPATGLDPDVHQHAETAESAWRMHENSHIPSPDGQRFLVNWRSTPLLRQSASSRTGRRG